MITLFLLGICILYNPAFKREVWQGAAQIKGEQVIYLPTEEDK